MPRCKGKNSTQTPNQIPVQMKSNCNWIRRLNIHVTFTSRIGPLQKVLLSSKCLRDCIGNYSLPHSCMAFFFDKLKKLQIMHTLGNTTFPCRQLQDLRDFKLEKVTCQMFQSTRVSYLCSIQSVQGGIMSFPTTWIIHFVDILPNIWRSSTCF